MLLPDYVTRVSCLSPVGPHEAEGFFHRSHSRVHTRRFRYSQTLFLFSTLSSRLSLFSCIYHFIPFLIVYHTFSSLYVFHLSPMLPIFKDIKYPPFLCCVTLLRCHRTPLLLVKRSKSFLLLSLNYWCADDEIFTTYK